MKAVYDKLLFILALLLLAASVAYFFFVAKDPAQSLQGELLTQQPSGIAYEAIAAPKFERNEVLWPAPGPQDADGSWLFDVFTPPRIYWDPVAQKLISEPWQAVEVDPPFGLELVSVDQELFRIQLEAYFAASNPEETQLQFYNSRTGTAFRGVVGTTFPEHQVRIDKFEITRESGDDGSLVTVGTATIFDLENNQPLDLTTTKTLYIPGKYIITVEAVEPLPTETIVWKAVGDKYQSGDVTFVLDAFDLEAKTVTVTKTSPKLPDGEQVVLNARVVAAPEEPAPEVAPEQEGAAEGGTTIDIDSLFR